jgi:hypothetical protein
VSIQSKEVNVNELRGSFHKNYENVIKRIHVSQNKQTNYSLSKPAPAKVVALINSSQDIKQYFKKLKPKIIQNDNTKIKYLLLN